jgi:hypothetical protein
VAGPIPHFRKLAFALGAGLTMAALWAITHFAGAPL